MIAHCEIVGGRKNEEKEDDIREMENSKKIQDVRRQDENNNGMEFDLQCLGAT